MHLKLVSDSFEDKLKAGYAYRDKNDKTFGVEAVALGCNLAALASRHNSNKASQVRFVCTSASIPAYLQYLEISIAQNVYRSQISLS